MAIYNRWVFNHYDPTNGHELWITDDTSAGTVLVKDIHPGSNSSYPYEITAHAHHQ